MRLPSTFGQQGGAVGLSCARVAFSQPFQEGTIGPNWFNIVGPPG
jgi:hypothetical protein